MQLTHIDTIIDVCKRCIEQFSFYSSVIPRGGRVENISQLLCNEALWKFAYTSQIPQAYPTSLVHFDFLGSSPMRSIYAHTLLCFETEEGWFPTLQGGTGDDNWQLLIERRMRHGLPGIIRRNMRRCTWGSHACDGCVCVFFFLFFFSLLIPTLHTPLPLPFVSLSHIVTTYVSKLYDSQNINFKNKTKIQKHKRFAILRDMRVMNGMIRE